MRRWLSVGLIFLAVLLGSAAPAAAHNQLTGSDPEDGARLEQGPQQVRLTFLASADPDGAELAVTGPDGAPAVAGEPEFDGTDVTIPVRAGLAGEYEVAYRVLSNDGHWAEGSITFTVTVGEQPSPSPPPPPSPSPSPPPASSPAAEQVAPAAGTDGDGDGPLLPWWFWLLVLAGGGLLLGLAIRRRSVRRSSAR